MIGSPTFPVHTCTSGRRAPASRGRVEGSDMTGRISRWLVWVGCLLMLAVAIGGCGGGDEGTQDASAAPSVGASAPPATDVSEAATADGAGGGGQTYVVRSGDTLSAIAQQFDTTVEAIVDANDIKDPDAIDVGEEFVIPAGR